MSKSEELLQRHEKLKREYFTCIHHESILNVAITSWSNSNDVTRYKHIESLQAHLQFYKNRKQIVRLEIEDVEQSLRKSHTKYTPLIQKDIKSEKK